MALTRLYYIVGGVTLFFLSFAPLIITVKKNSHTFLLSTLTPPPKIFFLYLLTFCLLPCYAIHIAKNRVGDRILGYFNLRVFTNQPTKN
jgi:hypothetical protein